MTVKAERRTNPEPNATRGGREKGAEDGGGDRPVTWWWRQTGDVLVSVLFQWPPCGMEPLLHSASWLI